MDFLEMNLKVYFLVSFSGLVGPDCGGFHHVLMRRIIKMRKEDKI